MTHNIATPVSTDLEGLEEDLMAQAEHTSLDQVIFGLDSLYLKPNGIGIRTFSDVSGISRKRLQKLFEGDDFATDDESKKIADAINTMKRRREKALALGRPMGPTKPKPKMPKTTDARPKAQTRGGLRLQMAAAEATFAYMVKKHGADRDNSEQAQAPQLRSSTVPAMHLDDVAFVKDDT